MIERDLTHRPFHRHPLSRLAGAILLFANNSIGCVSPEVNPRGLKQVTGLEMCQSRTKRSQRTHIFCSILSFLALEKKRLEENISWYEAKSKIIQDALFLCLKSPMIPLPVRT